MQLYTSVSAESSFSHPICPLFRVFALTCPQNGILCTLIVFMSGFCTRSSVHFLGYILVLGLAAVDALGLENVNEGRANLAGDDFDGHGVFPFRPYMGIQLKVLIEQKCFL